MNRAKFFMFFMSISCAFGFLHTSSTEAKPLKLCPVVALEGSWYNIGYQTAYYFRDTIDKGAKQFRKLGVSPKKAQKYYDQVEGLIHKDIKEQIQGMRDGLLELGLTKEPQKKELIWNFAQDILQRWDLGCTAFAFNSKDNGTFLAHNTDNVAVTIAMNTVIHFKPDNGDHSFLSWFAPGFVGVGMGINDQKLALSFNVGEPNKNKKPGLPVVFKAREVMAQCDNLECAIALFSQGLGKEKSYGEMGAILIVVDFKKSAMARIEICSDKMSVTYGNELDSGNVTYSAVANHYEGPCALQKPGIFRPLALLSRMFRVKRKDSSYYRYKRLMEMLTTEGISYDMETCWWIVTDSNGKLPNNRTICRKGFPVSTTATHVLSERFCYYSLGLPSEYLAKYGKPLFIDLDDGLSRAVKPSITGVAKRRCESLDLSTPIVLISLPEGDAELTTYTFSKGRFVFNNLVAGKYRVRDGTNDYAPSEDVYYDGETVLKLDFNLKNDGRGN
jgi:hypothetical protein